MSRANTSDPAQRIVLTARQEDVIRLIARGLTNAEIAERIGITLDGVKWHVREIFGKLGVESREEAVERWQADRGASRRVRMWASSLLASTTVRLAGGLALASGAGVVSVAAVMNSLRPDTSEEPSVAVAASVTPDPSTKDGLTLHIDKVETDDTLTTITFTLDGRPELGRLSGPARGIIADPATGLMSGPMQTRLTDQDGASYQLRSARAVAEGSPYWRAWTLTFDPVPVGTRTLTLEMAGMPFVAPAAETQVGQRPPDASAVIDGPWAATVNEVPRAPVTSVAVDPAPRTFGIGSIIVDEVLQTATETVIRAHLVDWPPQGPGLRYDARLVDTAGKSLEMTGGRWGDGLREELIELRFARAAGPVMLSIQGIRGLALSEADIEANVKGQNLLPEQAATYREHVRSLNEASALAASYFEGQDPAVWNFTLP